jgi:Family of unknown function (DUF1028)/FG-GAP-like repeat
MARFTRAGLGFAAAASLALSAGQAQATWSMIIIDTRTGEVAVGSCTCLTGIDLQALTPVLIVGVGAAAAQSAGDTTQRNRTFLRDRLWERMAPDDIVTALSVFDPNHQSRQYGIADVLGRAATFTGADDGAWAGGQTGSFSYTYAGQTGTIVYAVQGNVLTGEPVVQMAVDALHNTAGDLPARFMAAMQAARSMGGDGRCSCPGGVTSCGSPPPTFTKSAHIGYMLVARAGDKDGCSGVWPSGLAPNAVAAADFDNDGKTDLVSANRNSSTATLFRNVTPTGDPFAILSAGASISVGVQPSIIRAVDLTGDTIPDLVCANSLSVSVNPGLGGFTFTPHADTTTAAGASGMVIANFDGTNGPDVSCILTNSTLATLLNDGAGNLAAPLTRTAGTNPNAITVLDTDGNGTMDIVVTNPSTARLLVFRGAGNGTFTAGTPVTTPPSPSALGSGDFNGDGRPDLIVACGGTAPTVTVYLNNGAGGFTLNQTISLPAGLGPNDMAVCDLNGDGSLDAIVSTSSSRFFWVTGSPTGTFNFGGVSGVPFPISHITGADMNGDGKADAAYALASQNEVGISNNRGDGTFQPEAGTAGGDYFMSLNVPNAQAGDVDPVIQLQSMYDTWRTNLTGHADAVQSLVTVPVLDNFSAAHHTGNLLINLRDWQGQPVSAPISSVLAALAPGGDSGVTLGAVTNTGPGQYSLALTAGAQDGSDHLIITVDEGARKIVLMPQPLVTVDRCGADFDGDGDVGTDADIEAFFACLAGTCCPRCFGADFNRDGDVGTDADIESFFHVLGAGCGP